MELHSSDAVLLAPNSGIQKTRDVYDLRKNWTNDLNYDAAKGVDVQSIYQDHDICPLILTQ